MEDEDERQQQQKQKQKGVIKIPSYQEVFESSQPNPPPSLFRPSSSFSQAFSFIKSSEFYTPPPPPPSDDASRSVHLSFLPIFLCPRFHRARIFNWKQSIAVFSVKASFSIQCFRLRLRLRLRLRGFFFAVSFSPESQCDPCQPSTGDLVFWYCLRILIFDYWEKKEAILSWLWRCRCLKNAVELNKLNLENITNRTWVFGFEFCFFLSSFSFFYSFGFYWMLTMSFELFYYLLKCSVCRKEIHCLNISGMLGGCSQI